jgi:hypothetical protein
VLQGIRTPRKASVDGQARAWSAAGRWLGYLMIDDG